MGVQDIHPERETLAVSVNIPGHDPRGDATPLFVHSRLALLARDGGRCWISGQVHTAAAPLEAHHYPVERCFATAWDWPRFAADCKAGVWGPYAQAFDWCAFFAAAPFDPYRFVDDMTVNGRLLAKQFHIGKDCGVHALPEPIFYAQRYLVDGYVFSDFEVIHHVQ